MERLSRMNTNYYVNIIKERLTPGRFEHSLRVVETALQLAEEQDVSRDQVYMAALLHDIAKDLDGETLLSLAKDKGLVTCEAEELQPDLLHGPIGAMLCKEELNIQDEEVLQAIHYHTTGRVGMTELDKTVYLADLLEPGRKYQGIEELRRICTENLSQGLLFAFDSTLRYVLERKLLIHHLTVEARNWCILSMKE